MADKPSKNDDTEPVVPVEDTAPIDTGSERTAPLAVTPAPAAPPTAAAGLPPTEGSTRGRSIAAVVCLVLAGLLLTPAATAFWGQRTLNDTQRYVDTVDPLVDSPEVQDVIATKVVEAIEKQVDVEAIITDVFAGVIEDRPRLEQLVGPLEAAINGLIDREVRAFIASDQFADLWTRLNTRTQQAFHRVLTGEGTGAISVQGNEVVLDVDEVIEQVKQRLVDRGLAIVENVPVPETDRQIVLLESDELEDLRTIYAFGNPLARWMLPLVALLFLASFVLARRRPRMVVAIGAVIAANALAVALFLSVGRQLFVNQLSGTAFGPASRIFYNTLLAYLERGQQVLLGLGLVLVVAGWYAGRNTYGTAVRTSVGGVLENIGARLAVGQVDNAGRWVLANRAWLRVVTVVLGGVVLLWGLDVSPDRLWWTVAGVVVVFALIQVLVGAGRASTPAATRADVVATPAT